MNNYWDEFIAKLDTIDKFSEEERENLSQLMQVFFYFLVFKGAIGQFGPVENKIATLSEEEKKMLKLFLKPGEII